MNPMKTIEFALNSYLNNRGQVLEIAYDLQEATILFHGSSEPITLSLASFTYDE